MRLVVLSFYNDISVAAASNINKTLNGARKYILVIKWVYASRSKTSIPVSINFIPISIHKFLQGKVCEHDMYWFIGIFPFG